MIFLHILIALSSMAYTTYLLMAPVRGKFAAHYALIGLTVASGTVLLVTKPAHMIETCTMGLLYAGFVGILTFAARRKLAAQATRHQ